MKPVAIAKLALAASGIIVFGIGMRLENSSVRWTGIGLVAVAWLLRFVKESGTQDHQNNRGENDA